MATIKWLVTTSLTTLLSTGLDDLISGNETESAEFDNTAGLDLMADFIFAAAYASAPAANVKCAELYIEPAVDGTNYPTVTAGGLPQKSLLIGAFELPQNIATLQYMVLSGVPLPPLKLKFRLSNTSAQTMASSATAKFLKIQPYRLQST